MLRARVDVALAFRFPPRRFLLFPSRFLLQAFVRE